MHENPASATLPPIRFAVAKASILRSVMHYFDSEVLYEPVYNHERARQKFLCLVEEVADGNHVKETDSEKIEFLSLFWRRV
jgi:hypothetical protein